MDPPPPYTPEASLNPLQYQPPPPLPPQLPPRPPPQTTTVGSWSQPGHARSASQTSLVPVEDVMKRKLLIIYIHGFMGNETSFQSFPTHLHNLLCVTLDPLGYLVHTKVYPKFKTRYNILVATENFSQWLSQFENDATDVVLVGHSMGGTLAAEVALLQDYTGKKRHRLLGIVAFDTPFLGMHPGVITAGLGSIFRPAAKSPAEEALYQNGGEGSSQSTVSIHRENSAGSQVDEFYTKRPARYFTVVVRKKEGALDSALHFINKHHSRLTHATGQYLMSHLEFGGCLADPIGLKNRYTAIRALEDGVVNPNGKVERVRFANYYTSSTGRTKLKPAVTVEGGVSGEVHVIPGPELQDDLVGRDEGSSSGYMGVGLHKRSASMSSYNTSSSIGDMAYITADPLTDDEYGGEPVALHIVDADEIAVADGRPPTGLLSNEKIPMEGTSNGGGYEKGYNEKAYNGKGCTRQSSIGITRQPTGTDSVLNEKIPLSPEEPEESLSPLPPPPEVPPTFDYSQIPDATVRKAAEKKAAKVWKKYEKSVKGYEKAIQDREKELEKCRRHKEKEIERGEDKEIKREQKEREKNKEREEREERDRLREIRGKEREERGIEKEREKREREMQKDLERKKRELKRDRKQCHEKGGSTQEKQLEHLRKEQERMDAEYRRMNGIPEPPANAPSGSSSHSHLPISPAAPQSKSTSPQPNQKKKREHRFCILPSDKNDKCWVKVEMEGVDEVGAHCGLFFVNQVYERLVGDVAAKIEDWVGEEGSMRFAEEEEGRRGRR